MAQPTSNPNDATRSAKRPIQTIRYSTVRAAIWRNVIDNGNASRAAYNVTFSRSYKDGDIWKESHSFGRDDLLLLAKLASDAHTWIFRQRSEADVECS